MTWYSAKLDSDAIKTMCTAAKHLLIWMIWFGVKMKSALPRARNLHNRFVRLMRDNGPKYQQSPKTRVFYLWLVPLELCQRTQTRTFPQKHTHMQPDYWQVTRKPSTPICAHQCMGYSKGYTNWMGVINNAYWPWNYHQRAKCKRTKKMTKWQNDHDHEKQTEMALRQSSFSNTKLKRNRI